jgi:predicted nucleic acid-binding protein
MITHIIRAVYLLVVLAFTMSFALEYRVFAKGVNVVTAYIIAPVVVSFVLVMLDMFWRKKRLQMLSGLFFGVLAGLVIAYGLAKIVDLAGTVFGEQTEFVQAKAAPPAEAKAPAPAPSQSPAPSAAPALSTAPAPTSAPTTRGARVAGTRKIVTTDDDGAADVEAPILALVKMLLGASAIFMCVSFVMQTKDDFRFVIPYVEFSKESKGPKALLLDTSVIIDGRIADIAETNILDSELIVPRFVLAELQAIADSDDKLKRNRGRRGLDVLNKLQGSGKIDIRIMDTHVAAVDDAADVDAKLVALARHLEARVVTNDYNLNKVAQLRKVDVININDLANALKPIVLPGETLAVKMIKPGEEPGQGVGYLEDGTMVVAEQGRDHLGREIVITVTSVLQTSAGRMIFGKLDIDKTLGPTRKA